jgi:ectoine hydroxylase-related dioxygenase (phytanoyl-CoA dioxygenase family)
MESESKSNIFLEMLAKFGVTESTLSPEEKLSLDERGYIILHDFIDPEWLSQLQNRFEELIEIEQDKAGSEFGSEAGTRRLSDLINKGEVFDQVWMHPKMLAAAYHVIGRDFKMNSINARDALPGEGHQQLHADASPRWKEEDPYQGINTLWLLDDFTAENGATRIVPNTQKLLGKVEDYVEDAFAPHPDEQLIIAKAGTVVAYNFQLWHGGTLNRTSLKRRVLHPSFIARELPQQYDQQKFLKESTLSRLSPEARYLLDVE